jgi:exodeoxyribonuclease V alpha subunit
MNEPTTWVEGRLERVLWASDSSGYAVVRFTDGADGFVAVGQLADLAEQAEGAFVALEGRWEDHSVHGKQFRCLGALHGSPRSLEGMELYLGSSGVKGVGPALAKRLVEHFGMATPTVLSEDPKRVAEVPGIGPSKAKAIREAWQRDEQGRALAMTLRGLGVSRRLVQRIRERYGDKAPNVVLTTPYRLAEEISGIGFRTADALARNLGLPADDPGRVRAAVSHCLDQESQDGHCWTSREQLVQRMQRLDVPTEGLDAAIDAAVGSGRVVHEGDQLWLASLHEAERTVARELTSGLSMATVGADDDEAIARAERWESVTLDPGQRAAVRRALKGGPVVITGGPGTGKTTLLRVLLRVWTERGLTIRLASPTGRAAKRLQEATGQPASTLHRLLEFNPGEGGFQRGPGKLLEGDGLIIDEASMVDVELMAATLQALPYDQPGYPLVLVGDADQLPSVGPGQVLRDLVEAPEMPVARLSIVHRQAADSGIIQAAAEVHGGSIPGSGERTGHSDVFLLDRPDADSAAETLLTVVTERLVAKGFDPFVDVQVLAPTRRGPLGTERLNALLQARLNPDGQQLKRGDKSFRVGDRVLCIRNRYDVEVFNGDVGRVVAAKKGGLDVDFDGRVVEWERDDLGLLDLAYAVTVHKSQGSEYPAVVLALHGSHSLLLKRNLFYTAITRAKRFLCVVGSRSAWSRAVSDVGEDTRRTALRARLAGAGEEVLDDLPLGWIGD